jgi:hypothetical protein
MTIPDAVVQTAISGAASTLDPKTPVVHDLAKAETRAAELGFNNIS